METIKNEYTGISFFNDLKALAPQRSINLNGGEGWSDFADKEKAQRARAGLKDEVERFMGYLMERQPDDRVTVLELITNEILVAYYDVRLAMKGLNNKEKDKGRPSMNALYEAITLVIAYANRLKINYSDEFLNSWEKRASYLPFWELIRSWQTCNQSKKQIDKAILTEEAKAIFQKAIDAGLCSLNGTNYNWNFEEYTGQLLAYFCERMSHYLSLSNKLDKDGYKTVNWKIFERLFNVKNIKSYKYDWMKYNNKFTPNGYEIVDELFD